MTKNTVTPKGGLRRSPTLPVLDPTFEAVTAYENLRTQIVRIDAVSSAANTALEDLPTLARGDQRALDRLWALVELTHEIARATLATFNNEQRRLSDLLKQGGRHV